MIRYLIYSTSTGRVRAAVTGLRTFAEDNLQDGEAIAETEDDANSLTHWVFEGVVGKRPINPGFGKLNIAADDTDAARLVMGDPFTAEIDGVSYPIDQPDEDGDYVLEITSAMPATYKVTVKHFPFLDYTAEVVAA